MFGYKGLNDLPVLNDNYDWERSFSLQDPRAEIKNGETNRAKLQKLTSWHESNRAHMKIELVMARIPSSWRYINSYGNSVYKIFVIVGTSWLSLNQRNLSVTSLSFVKILWFLLKLCLQAMYSIYSYSSFFTKRFKESIQ